MGFFWRFSRLNPRLQGYIEFISSPFSDIRQKPYPNNFREMFISRCLNMEQPASKVFTGLKDTGLLDLEIRPFFSE